MNRIIHKSFTWMVLPISLTIMAAVTLLLSVAGCAAGDEHADKLLFISDRGGDRPVAAYRIYPDGTGLKRLTPSHLKVSSADWSPTGDEIVFEGQPEDGKWGIYTMSRNGKNLQRITDGSGGVAFPKWSPRGNKVTFTREIVIGSYYSGNNFVINIDGTGIIDLSSFRYDENTWILIPETIDDIDLSNARALDGYPAWSPDGTKIAFSSLRDGSPEQIYTIDVNGTDIQKITDLLGQKETVAWSPGGDNIAFASDMSGNWEIYTINADGTGVTNVTNNDAKETAPAWSPDGERIAFASDRDGNWEIYVMNADGSNQTRLTDNPATDLYPSWSPN